MHDDLDRGTGGMSMIELSETMGRVSGVVVGSFTQLVPIEVWLQAGWAALILLQGNYLLFLVNLPLLLYNLRAFSRKEHKFYCITRLEYKQESRNLRVLRFKLLFYLLMAAIAFLK